MVDRIDIQIQDKISASIVRKLSDIASKSRKAHEGVERLKDAMKVLDGYSAKQGKLTQASQKAQLNQDRLNQSWLRSEAALNRAVNAESQAQRSLAKLNNETKKGSILQQQLAQSVARTAQAESNAANAASRAANAESQAQRSLAKLNNETKKGDILQQQLAQSIARTAQAESNAANAASRAANAESQAQRSLAKLNNETRKGGILQQQLEQSVARTAQAESNAANAASRAANAESRAAIAAIKLTKEQKKLSSAVRGTSSAFTGFIRTLLTYVGIGFGIREIARLADSYTILQNKLKNVTDSQEQLAQITDRVFKIANKTRTDVDATAQAFQRFDRALIQLGGSQEETARLTQTVNELLVTGGAAPSEQTAALLQLSQAFNKGKLDGDEFRTVMELMPGVADAIAKQLGVMRGELLKLAPEGKITAQVMREALASVAEETDKKFAKTIPTIGQGFTVLKNKAIKFLGEINSKYRVTERFSKFLILLGDNLKGVAVALTGTGAAILTGFAPALARGLKALQAFGAAIATNPWGLLIAGLVTAIAYLAIFQNDIKVSADGVVSFGDTVRGTMIVIKDSLAPVIAFFKESWKSAFEEASSKADGFQKFFGKVLKGIGLYLAFVTNYWISLFVGTFNAVRGVWDKFPAFLKAVFFAGVNGAIDALNMLLKAVTVAVRAPIALINQLLSRLGKEKIKLDDFIEIPKLNVVKKDMTDVFGVIKNSYKEAFSTDYVGEFVYKVKNASREIANQRISDEKRVKDELRKAGPAPIPQPARDAMKAVKKVKKEEYIAPPTPFNIQNGSDGMLNQIYDETITKSRELEDATKGITSAYELGFINLETYQQKMLAVRQSIIDTKLAMNEASTDDILFSALGRMTEGFQNVATSIRDAFGDLFSNLSNGFANSIGDAIVMGENLGQSLKRVAQQAVSGLISAIIKMGIQWVVTQAMMKSAGITAMAAQTTASVAAAQTTAAAWAPAAAMASLASFGANSAPASAGIASTTGLASSLAALPGFKDGGYTGNLDRDEVAGLVHGREYVMNAEAVDRIGVANLEAMNNGTPVPTQAQAPQVNVQPRGMKIVNVINPEMVADYLNSEDGDELFINMLYRNSDYVRSLG